MHNWAPYCLVYSEVYAADLENLFLVKFINWGEFPFMYFLLQRIYYPMRSVIQKSKTHLLISQLLGRVSSKIVPITWERILIIILLHFSLSQFFIRVDKL